MKFECEICGTRNLIKLIFIEEESKHLCDKCLLDEYLALKKQIPKPIVIRSED